jgi:hypothetical protein
MPELTWEIEKIEPSTVALLVSTKRHLQESDNSWKEGHIHQAQLQHDQAVEDQSAHDAVHPKSMPLIVMLKALIAVLQVIPGSSMEVELAALNAQLDQYRTINPLFAQGISFP